VHLLLGMHLLLWENWKLALRRHTLGDKRQALILQLVLNKLRTLDSHRHVCLSSVVVEVRSYRKVGAFVLLVFFLLSLLFFLLSLDHVGTTGQGRNRLLRWRFSILAQLPVEVEHFLIAEELVACPDLVLAKLGWTALQKQADV
jgi:hypothetical protein